MKLFSTIKPLKLLAIIILSFDANADEPRFYIPDAPEIGAASYVVMDHNSGQIIASNNENERRSPASLTFIFFTYVFVNIAMVSGLLPVVGVPLPLISYGGSSLLTLMTSLGIIMSIYKHKTPRYIK